MSNEIYERHPDGVEQTLDEILFDLQEQLDRLEMLRSQHPIGMFADKKLVGELLKFAKSMQRKSKGLVIFINQSSEVHHHE